MILSVQNISKAFLEKDILKQVNFHIEDTSKTAIVGINGAGKSTLLKIIVGELEPDEGQVVLAKDKKIGYLSQHQDFDSTCTIFEEMLKIKQHILDMETQMRQMEFDMKTLSGEALDTLMKRYSDLSHQYERENGYAYHSECVGVLKGLGFCEDDFKKTISTLSGGQKTRVALGRLLLLNPDLFWMSRPTTSIWLPSAGLNRILPIIRVPF